MRSEVRRTPQPDDEISLLAVGAVILRYRRLLGALVIAGAVAGVAVAWLSSPKYVSRASFIPREADVGNSELAMAASQFGIRIPATGSGWGPPVYVEVLRSQALLEPIATDSVTISSGQRVALMNLLEVKSESPQRRVDLTVKALRKMMNVSEERAIRGVRIVVTTKWPTVSHQLAQRLLSGVNQFNLEVRKSQAVAERQFVEAQVAQSTSDLAIAEARLKDFLQRNRSIIGSPELTFERDRLQRDVALRRELHTSWLQNREDARIREVRDTPVITVLEEPRLATAPEPRGGLQKGILGAVLGALLGIFISLVRLLANRANAAGNEDAREFFQLVDQVRPAFLRRGRRSARSASS